MAQVIVVGGGLSGLSAAHTVLEHGGNVVVLDKMPFFGGNSTKATSGINGALTRTQISKGIQDSAQKFYEDTALSARDLIRPPLVKVLTYNSASAVEWLQDKFNLDLSLVSRLGGTAGPALACLSGLTHACRTFLPQNSQRRREVPRNDYHLWSVLLLSFTCLQLTHHLFPSFSFFRYRCPI